MLKLLQLSILLTFNEGITCFSIGNLKENRVFSLLPAAQDFKTLAQETLH